MNLSELWRLYEADEYLAKQGRAVEAKHHSIEFVLLVLFFA
ncbi:hypothetical protein [Paenibacillus harenae]|uniref:Uncharacterized protein n=1 Tax=Paenibacillus harenae TaxID=306543 RepID=A0ABT9U0X2_PAEHA|nr:hypothetical protein [Paenibacillus harenae]MDQ0111954.1 hypothetical protein [Paenibacillus harenae]